MGDKSYLTWFLFSITKMALGILKGRCLLKCMEDSFGNKCQSLEEWGAHNKISSEDAPLDLNERDVVSPEEKHHKNWE